MRNAGTPERRNAEREARGVRTLMESDYLLGVTDETRLGRLSIAKFPRENDEYSMETWAEVALRLAERTGLAIPHHEPAPANPAGRRVE